MLKNAPKQLKYCNSNHLDMVSLNTVAQAAIVGSGLSIYAKTFVSLPAFHTLIEV